MEGISENQIIHLHRWGDHDQRGTFGDIYGPGGEHICLTLERSWEGNKGFVSCIPSGIYELVPFVRGNGDEVYALRGDGVYVTEEEMGQHKGRFAILIHSANWMDELAGCIAPGSQFMCSGQRLGVGSSRAACASLFSFIRMNGIKAIHITNGGPKG